MIDLCPQITGKPAKRRNGIARKLRRFPKTILFSINFLKYRRQILVVIAVAVGQPGVLGAGDARVALQEAPMRLGADDPADAFRGKGRGHILKISPERAVGVAVFWQLAGVASENAKFSDHKADVVFFGDCPHVVDTEIALVGECRGIERLDGFVIPCDAVERVLVVDDVDRMKA